MRRCIVSCTMELSCFNVSTGLFVFLVLIFSLTFLPVPRPFCFFVNVCRKTFNVQYVVWPSKGRPSKLSPLGVRACACARVYAWICLFLYVCMWHTFALQVATQQQARSQRRKVFKIRGKKDKKAEVVYYKALHTHTPISWRRETGEIWRGMCSILATLP